MPFTHFPFSPQILIPNLSNFTVWGRGGTRGCSVFSSKTNKFKFPFRILRHTVWPQAAAAARVTDFSDDDDATQIRIVEL